jgi:hypothetical protein
VRRPRIEFLRRRRPMRFRETIGQHFRRVLVSKPFRSCKRGSPHEMGAGAIEARGIAGMSTEIGVRDQARVCDSRRRPHRQEGDGGDALTGRGKKRARGPARPGWNPCAARPLAAARR